MSCCNLARHGSDTDDHGLTVFEASGLVFLSPQQKLEKRFSVDENHPGVEA